MSCSHPFLDFCFPCTNQCKAPNSGAAPKTLVLGTFRRLCLAWPRSSFGPWRGVLVTDLTLFCIRVFSVAQTGLDQYAIKKFAEALEVVPRILSETSGQDAEKVCVC